MIRKRMLSMIKPSLEGSEMMSLGLKSGYLSLMDGNSLSRSNSGSKRGDVEKERCVDRVKKGGLG